LWLAYCAGLAKREAPVESVSKPKMCLKNSGGKEVNCKICDREAKEKGFCPIHLKAYENLVDRFDLWKKALDISWKEYLSEIAKNDLAGNWVKEVGKYLIENEET
jgi:hypothetical protein